MDCQGMNRCREIKRPSIASHSEPLLDCAGEQINVVSEMPLLGNKGAAMPLKGLFVPRCTLREMAVTAGR